MTDWVIVPDGGQGEPKRIENALAFLAEVETFIGGLRRWDWKSAVHDAEVQLAVVRLCEDPDFVACLRAEWSQRVAPEGTPASADLLTILTDHAPDLFGGFLDALMCYMEKDKGELI